MVTLLLKKSFNLLYHITQLNEILVKANEIIANKNLKEDKFNNLWNYHGIFTTMRIIGKPQKILFFKEHIDNLIRSLKIYKINKKNLKKNILKLIKLNIDKNKKFDLCKDLTDYFVMWKLLGKCC